MGRRQWHPTLILLPGKSHGRRSLVGCSPWGCEEWDMTEQLHFHFSLFCIGEGNGNPLQCSCLENPRDGVTHSRTRLKWLSSSSKGCGWDSEPYAVSCLKDTETPTRWKTPTTWWPDCSRDISCHSLKNWPQRNGNKLTLELKIQFSSVQSLSHVRLFATPWTAACQASLSITNFQSPPKPMFIESVMPSNRLILCRPLLLPSIFPSIRVFSNESALCIRWPKYWSFSFNIRPSNEHPGLISFRMDWLYLLAVQGTLKSLLQHYSSIASILRHSAFLIVQLLHPYMTTGKTIVLTRQTSVGKVMFLLFNMLSRLVITFLPRNKRLLISWVQSPSAVILEPRKI